MSTRRAFFSTLAGASAVGLGYGLGHLAFAHRRASFAGGDAVVEGEDTPLEDLMREHAVLERVLLVYEECSLRLESGIEVAPRIVGGAAAIVRGYIEDHHERDEELHVFPRLASVGIATELVDTLLAQHVAGRRVTTRILEMSSVTRLREPARVVHAMRSFVRMYRPHAAHENTVLFPAFRKAVSQAEYEQLRVTLERSELDTFGPDLYATTLQQVRGLERELAIGELAAFTPGDHDD